MPKIIQLDRHVADLIAAGEVVERPASAVKELVENSIDAGAKNITIELQNGGMTFLRITDDGCGMEPVDARTAFLRHATSKIRKKRILPASARLVSGARRWRPFRPCRRSTCSRGRRARKTASGCIWRRGRSCPRSLPDAHAARQFWCGSCFTTRPRG